GRPVVDDEPLDLVEAGHLTRQVGEGDGEGLLLVQARDLDDQLHRRRQKTVSRTSSCLTAWTAPRSPGRAAAAPCRPRSRGPAGGRASRSRRSRSSAWDSSSATSSSLPIPSTTPTTTCCGAVGC